MEDILKRPLSVQKICIVLGCALGSVVTFLFLYEDLTRNSPKGHGPEIAKVASIHGSIKRKSEASFIWSKVSAGESLYFKESIQAGPGASAVLLFNDESKLEISEQSLVILDKVKSLDLNFLKGQFIVRDKDKDLKIQIKDSGEKIVEKLPVRLLTPGSHEELFALPSEKLKVKMSWEVSDNKDRPTRLEISTRRDFKEGFSEYALKSENNYSVPLAPGTYYWRLSLEKNKLSEIRSFSVHAVHSVALLSPSDGAKIRRPFFAPELQFRWKPNEETYSKDVSHFLEISQDPLFRENISKVALNLSSGFQNFGVARSGQWYWRIKSDYPNRTLVSEVNNFDFALDKKWDIQWLNPRKDAVLFDDKPLSLKWETPEGSQDISYEIRIFDTKNKVVFETKTDQSFALWEKPQAGAFKAQIKAFFKKENISISQPLPFEVFGAKSVEIFAPKQGQLFKTWTEPVPVKFEWHVDSQSKVKPDEFEIQFAENPQFQPVLFSQKTGKLQTQREFPAIEKKYFWRIVMLQNNQKIGVSDPIDFSVHYFETLSAPQVTFPAAGATLKVETEDAEPTFKWSQVESSKSYVFEIRSGEKAIYKTTTENTEIKAPGIKDGVFEAHITAVDPKGRLGTPAKVIFKMDHGATLKPPPKIKVEIDK